MEKADWYHKKIEAPGEIIYELTGASQKDFSVAVVELRASLPHCHQYGLELYVLLEGEAKVFLNGEAYYLTEPFERVVIPKGIEHFAQAIGISATVLVIKIPAWTEEDHILSGSEEKAQKKLPPRNPIF